MPETPAQIASNHWCPVCAQSDSPNPASRSAITGCWFIGPPPDGQEAMVYVSPAEEGSLLHVHNLVITTREQLTIRAAIGRRIAEIRRRIKAPFRRMSRLRRMRKWASR